MKLLDYPASFYDQAVNSFGFVEDFALFNPASPPVAWAVNGTTPTILTSVGNPLSLATSNVDNNTSDLTSARKRFKFADGKPMIFRAIEKFTEATVSGQTNFVAGFHDQSTTATMVANNGAGLPGSWNGAVFYGIDGDTKLKCAVSGNSVVQTMTCSTTDANNRLGADVLLSSASKRKLEILVKDYKTGVALVEFFVDNQLVADFFVSTASAAALGCGVAVKTGSGNIQTCVVDMVQARQQW